MVGIGSDLKMKAGPLPVWAWAGLGSVGLAGFLIVKKKKSMDQATTGSDTSGTIPGGPSNLIPQAQPMPYTMGGDTFVDTTVINNIPPGGSTKVTKPPVPKPTPLPAVDPSKSPIKIPQSSAAGKTMIKLGCFDKKGHYAGKQVSGGAPVYGLINKIFMQGSSVHAHGPHCIYVPAQFKAYIV
jgi:hypothetical protein